MALALVTLAVGSGLFLALAAFHSRPPPALVLVFFGLGALAGAPLLWAHFAAANAARDAAARQIELGGPVRMDKPLLFYLRPFATDALVDVFEPPARSALATALFLGIPNLGGLESKLVRATEKTARVVRLDERLAHPPRRWKQALAQAFSYRVCAIRTEGGDAWLPVFHRIADAADAFVLVPPLAIDASTTIEIAYLQSRGYLPRTAMLMPAGMRARDRNGRLADSRALWNNLRDLLGPRWPVPGFEHGGGWVVFAGDRPILLRGLGGKDWSRPATLRRLFSSEVLCDPAWLDALRMAMRLAWSVPLGIVVALGAVRLASDNPAVHPLAIWAGFGAGLSIAAASFYLYCRCFLLGPTAHRLTWFVSLVIYGVAASLLLSPVTRLVDGVLGRGLAGDAAFWVATIVCSVIASLFVQPFAWRMLARRPTLRGILANPKPLKPMMNPGPT